MTGLMNMTFPLNMRPGSVSDEKSSVWPTRTDASRDDGTDTVRSSTRLSTMRNIDVLPPMFSTRSPTLTPRERHHAVHRRGDEQLVQPRLGRLDLRPRGGHGRVRRLHGRLGVVEGLRGDQAVLLQLLRALVLALRAVLADLGLRLGRPQRLDAGLRLAAVEPRQLVAPLHGHPLGHVDLRHHAGHLGLHLGGELRLPACRRRRWSPGGRRPPPARR